MLGEARRANRWAWAALGDRWVFGGVLMCSFFAQDDLSVVPRGVDYALAGAIAVGIGLRLRHHPPQVRNRPLRPADSSL